MLYLHKTLDEIKMDYCCQIYARGSQYLLSVFDTVQDHLRCFLRERLVFTSFTKFTPLQVEGAILLPTIQIFLIFSVFQTEGEFSLGQFFPTITATL